MTLGRRRFALGYAIAWAPYATLYAAVFVAQGHTTVLHAVADASRNAVPAAAFGLLVLRAVAHLPWPARVGGPHRTRVGAFAATHVVLALGYSAALYTVIGLIRTAEVSARAGGLVSGFLVGPALQWQALAGLMLYGTIVGVGYAVKAASRLQREAELRARAELAALRAQLQPHFLFNTLHTLMALVRYEPAQAERAIERLAAMLRYTLDPAAAESARGSSAGPDAGAAPTDDVALREEWAFVEDYLALERLRLADRLRVTAVAEAGALDCRLPALTLQPLVENAVKHAVAPRPDGGTVHVSARVDAGGLRLEVRDDGPGAPAPDTPRIARHGDDHRPDRAGAAPGTGLGLQLVRARLRARYGEGASLDAASAPGGGFRAVVLVPVAVGVRHRSAPAPAPPHAVEPAAEPHGAGPGPHASARGGAPGVPAGVAP